jgi:8-oxo-dGTP pyrophosphatase MutT (NUDIX family)
MTSPAIVQHVDRLELTLTPKLWDFAVERAAEIETEFAARQRQMPALWNGPVLLLHRQDIRDGVFYGDFLRTDFASCSTWHTWGRPEAGIRDCSAAAAIKSADGAYVLGVMGQHTFNGGRIYFPCGVPDLSDIVDGKVDFDCNVQRELKEETGLDIGEFEAEPGWTMVSDGPFIAHMKVLHSNQTAEVLRERILAELAKEAEPELSDIRIVRSTADFDPRMLSLVTAFLEKRFAGN